MSFTLEHIHRTINNLGRLMPAKPNKDSSREYSLKECIFLMAPKLLEMREMGFTTNELLKGLMDDGVEIKAPTLNRYLCEYQKMHGDESEAQPKKAGNKAAQDSEPAPPNDPPESPERPKSFNGQSAKNGQDEKKSDPEEDKPSSHSDRPESSERPKPLFGQSAKSARDDSGPI